MHRNKLLNFLASNARKGEFKAEGNTIYLYDVIVSSKAEADWFGGVDAPTFAQTLKGLSGDVSLRINSPGGDVFGAKAMAQAIREYPGTVTAHVDGYAASAATYITSAADRTIMAPGAMMMIHKAWTLAIGNADDMMQTADLLEKIDGMIIETYAAAAAKRGVEGQDFAAMIAAETWLTGQEALDAGLADEIAAETVKASARWDLSAYEKAPNDDCTVTVTVTVEMEEEPAPNDPSEPMEPGEANNEIERMRRINAHRLRTPA